MGPEPLEEGEIGESFTLMETQGTKQHGEKLLDLSEPLGDTNGVSEEEKIDDEALKSGGKVEEIKKKPIRRNKYKLGQAHAKKKNTPCVDRPKKRSRVDREDDPFDLNRFLGLDHQYVDRPICPPEVLISKAVRDNDSSLQEAIDLNIRAYAENQDSGSSDRQQGEINEDA
ncbi:hypothetical protein L1987_73136 [Smallanthus sonchifolius]|uniref:Uncharacterized protein n=1 Tax=Smallanthus sonchifolius TaxID=185202 RepID=A0ACB8ZZC8_9ASTR|nr:hypothetical protein L1987_73136 [Smallanthus sonchifolius]